MKFLMALLIITVLAITFHDLHLQRENAMLKEKVEEKKEELENENRM